MKYVVPAALRDKRTICTWCKQLQDAGGAVLADGEFARTNRAKSSVLALRLPPPEASAA
jgi:hypothetical protein